MANETAWHGKRLVVDDDVARRRSELAARCKAKEFREVIEKLSAVIDAKTVADPDIVGVVLHPGHHPESYEAWFKAYVGADVTVVEGENLPGTETSERQPLRVTTIVPSTDPVDVIVAMQIAPACGTAALATAILQLARLRQETKVLSSTAAALTLSLGGSMAKTPPPQRERLIDIVTSTGCGGVPKQIVSTMCRDDSSILALPWS